MSDTKKILHIVHQYKPDFVGGTELYTESLAAEQVKRGHDVLIFVPSTQTAVEKETPFAIEKEPSGISVCRVFLGERSARQVFLATFSKQHLLLDVFTQVLAQFQPDIVHVQHLMGIPAQIMRQVQEANIPYVVTLHDYWYGCANAQLLTNYDETICDGPNALFTNCGRCAVARAGQTGLLSYAGTAVAPLMGYRNRLLKSILAGAKSVVPPTKFVQTTYENMSFSQVRFQQIPHGMNVDRELIEEARQLAPQARQACQSRLLAVFIGGISPQKGLHTLIDAFNQLPDDAELQIYGDLAKFPDYVAQLQSLITHPKIELRGRLPHKEIWLKMGMADVVVMPTHWYEASPLTIDEAFLAGSTLLASDLGAMSEKIQHGVDGWLVRTGDVQAWVDALEKFYKEPDLSARLKQNRPDVFTLERHVEAIDQAYI